MAMAIAVVVFRGVQAPDGNGHDRSRDVNPMPADMLRILSEAYAAQMEANLKAEDAMIRQVERMTIIERLPSTTCTSTSIVNLSEAQKECTLRSCAHLYCTSRTPSLVLIISSLLIIGSPTVAAESFRVSCLQSCLRAKQAF